MEPLLQIMRCRCVLPGARVPGEEQVSRVKIIQTAKPSAFRKWQARLQCNGHLRAGFSLFHYICVIPLNGRIFTFTFSRRCFAVDGEETVSLFCFVQ